MVLRATRIPAVIDRLVKVLANSADLSHALVLDGPIASGVYREVNVIIGWTDEDRPAATVTRRATGGIRANDIESWSIWALVGTVDGGTNGSSSGRARAKAAEAFAVIERIITADPTLGGTCGVITIGDQEWWQTPTANGIEAAVLFRLNGGAPL